MVNEYGAVGGMRIGRGNKCSEDTCTRSSLSTTNPTLSDLGMNSGRSGGKKTTKVPSYGMNPAVG
jgi:hypothetical protein